MLRVWQWRDEYRLPVIAAAAILAMVLPLGFMAAAFPARYSMLLIGFAALPLVVMVGLQLTLGRLLAVAVVSPPLVQFIVQGSPVGIPPAAVAPLFGVEALLLIRGTRYLRDSPRVPFIEVIFLGVMGYAAAVGLSEEGSDRRVWLAELLETTNLIVMLWLLRLNRFKFDDLRDFVLLGHVLALPFFTWYIITHFGEYRLDFFFSLSTMLIAVTMAVILHQRTSPGLRALLIFSCFVMFAATAAAGIRGATLGTMLAVGFVILFSLRQFSTMSVMVAFTGALVLVLVHPLLLRVAAEVAPHAVERFRDAAESPTLSVRLLEAQDAFRAFLDRPSGHGLGAVLVTRHEMVWDTTGIRIEYGPTTFVHNSYAWYLAKTGILGFLSLVALLAPAVLLAARRLSTTQGSAAIALTTFLALMVGAWGGPALHNIFATPWIAIALVLVREQSVTADSPTQAGGREDRYLSWSRQPSASTGNT